MICSQAVLARASRAAKQAARAGRMFLGQKWEKDAIEECDQRVNVYLLKVTFN